MTNFTCPMAVGVDFCINGCAPIFKSNLVPISSCPFVTLWVSSVQLSFWFGKDYHPYGDVQSLVCKKIIPHQLYSIVLEAHFYISKSPLLLPSK